MPEAARGTDRWDLVADSYGTSPVVARLAEGLVDLVGVSRHDSLIDVGTGTGLALLRAASLSGDGHAVGVDRSFAMLERAARAAARRRLLNIELVRGDAAHLPLPSHRFDVVLAASVWQFVGYSDEALAEWRRVLRAGGRLGLSVPGPGSGASIPGDLMSKYFAHLAPAAKEDFLERAARSRPVPDLAEAMTAAGFVEPHVVERSWDDTLAGPEDWWTLQWTHGVRFFLEGLNPEALIMLKDEALQRLARTGSGAVTLTTKVRYCVAHG